MVFGYIGALLFSFDAMGKSGRGNKNKSKMKERNEEEKKNKRGNNNAKCERGTFAPSNLIRDTAGRASVLA